ncbi:MAG TPA: branched-chain amino acid ABC transporter substrate-binding protein [Solirubrobacterales bacterium]|nr:branched-chain amino acid ABC transporter substrate-binding protein [Solirubrobacterales bacterium]
MPRPLVGLLALLACAVIAVGLIACGDDGADEAAAVEAVDANCGDVEYEGQGDPSALIVSDLPLQGDSAERSAQMNDAIRQELDDQGWQVGSTNVALQACDDSIEETGEWDEQVCRDNATAYAENSDVIGVIGTYNSGCAAEIIPILNDAPGGGLAMVSPGNTLVCLTEASATCEPDEPGVFYPSGIRNYARVVPNDAFQGAGLATFVQRQGVRNAFILYAGGDPTSKGQADTFNGAAKALGLGVAGFEPWDPEAAGYTELMGRVRKSDADGLILAGLLEQNGPQVIRDKVAVLGPNEGDGAAVQLFAPDGFAQQATIDDAGEASRAMFVSVPGRTPESLTGPGKTFVEELSAGLDGAPVELYAPYAGQAAELLLQAIAPSPDRVDVLEAVLRAEVENGIVGSFSITPTGDPSIGPISVSVARDTFELAETIEPPDNLVDAARGG